MVLKPIYVNEMRPQEIHPIDNLANRIIDLTDELADLREELELLNRNLYYKGREW